MLKFSFDLNGNLTSQTAGNVLLPKIIGQPVKRVVEPGQVATFSVVVEDTSGVTFQWQFNGTDITGTTGDSLLLPNVNDANVGQYSVVVTNSAGSVTSVPAALLLDSDRDGLPDDWETANFGNIDSQRSEGDPDTDKVSNLDEFIDNTNPLSGGSRRFRLIAYSDAGGSVTVSPMKLSYDLGETVTLTATAFAPSVFIGWDKDLTGTINPVSVTMNGNQTIRARFVSAVPLPTGLVAFWRGEKDATDLIGGHDGTFFFGITAVSPKITSEGKVGGAFDFDGTMHVRVPSSPETRPAQVTLAVWVFPTLLSSSSQTVIAHGSTWAIVFRNGELHYFQGNTGISLPEQISRIPLNQWTHLAATFDGTTARLYSNGIQVDSKTWQDTLPYDPAVPVTIGSSWINNAPGDLFNGRIDEVAIYNRALTQNEIWDIYNAFLWKDVSQPYFTTSSPLPKTFTGVNFTQQLTTVLGSAPISFSLSAGLLPPGITLAPTGLLNGSTQVSGIFDFTVMATDSTGVSTEQLFVLQVI